MDINTQNNNLVGRKILFIGPQTFNYEKEIIKCLERMGASVNYFDDRPFESSIKKIALRMFPRLLKTEIRNYFSDIILNTKNQTYDYVFCIKLECFPLQLLKQLRIQQNQAKFIFYTWDSLVNSSNAISCFTMFDRALSFDDKDVKKHGLLHRPLFYLNDYNELCDESLVDENKDYDVMFVGSVHIHRFQFINDFLKQSEKELNCFIYMFVPSKLLFWARKILLFPIYGRSKAADFRFESLSSLQISNIMVKSKAVLDYALPSQDGLTMRSIEALGARKKLITNNKNILNYDFYTPQNILVVSNAQLEEYEEFINTPYEPINENIYLRYSLEGWVKEVFGLSHD